MLRVVLRALDEVRETKGQTPIRLQRVEAAVEAFRAAVAERRALRRTLAGTILAYDGKRTLTLSREAVRRRGRWTRPSTLEEANRSLRRRTALPHELE
jgi:hypothetical protein